MKSGIQVQKRALVTGGAGQDGWYLIERLLSLGYEVFAHSRRLADRALHGGRVSWHTGDLTDEPFLKNLLSVSKPDEIDWTQFVVVDPLLLRKVDSHFTQADPSKIQSQLAWHPKVDFLALVAMMVQERSRILKSSLQSQPLSTLRAAVSRRPPTYGQGS